jgi:hypothetical protein
LENVSKPCPKCLPDGESLESAITAYVDSMDDCLKADETEYRRRLSLCGDCSELVNGMCISCGCFVAARAAKKGARCAKIEMKW